MGLGPALRTRNKCGGSRQASGSRAYLCFQGSALLLPPLPLPLAGKEGSPGLGRGAVRTEGLPWCLERTRWPRLRQDRGPGQGWNGPSVLPPACSPLGPVSSPVSREGSRLSCQVSARRLRQPWHRGNEGADRLQLLGAKPPPPQPRSVVPDLASGQICAGGLYQPQGPRPGGVAKPPRCVSARARPRHWSRALQFLGSIGTPFVMRGRWSWAQ